ncbi:MAG TPA: S1/P1 nuclease [Terriglobales bacterium]|jgi:hypothetical protein|nr:S1/P1 nuclease [Terriglobales bacterium]
MTRKRLLCFFALFLFPAASVQAHAWGCEGHQIVALLAMRHLQPQIANQVNAILAASPVPLSLRHFCRTSGLPLIAEVASWADDIRSEQPETGPLHFVDIPLTATREKYEINQACQQGCVIDAIAKFTEQLKGTDAKARADALRYIIHFVGDIHQPLHDESNGDRGGNCVPVEYLDEAPRMTNSQREDYFPNLHAIWDTDLLLGVLSEHDMTVEQFADFLDRRYQPRLQRWSSGKPVDWAWEGHEGAVTAYRALPASPPHDAATVEPTTCVDNNHIAKRIADLHIVIGERYENIARPIVEEQLTKAGIRLAALLNTAVGR